MATHRPPIVVGIDGSSTSLDALRWAAHRAEMHHSPLHLVYAVGAPPDIAVEFGVIGFNNVELRAEGEDVLASAAKVARKSCPDIAIETEVVDHAPAPVLLARSREAQMIVVGTRGLGALGRGLLGSVSTSLARHAHGPVAVIPDADDWPDDLLRLPVVVGVDGSPRGQDAVEIAFDEASRLGVELIAVTTWSESFRYISRAGMQQEARARQAENMAGQAERHPDVSVNRVVAQDRAARRILAEAKNAQLIVVGSHGRGGFAGMTLGSVGHAVLHASPLPVIVARARE